MKSLTEIRWRRYRWRVVLFAGLMLLVSTVLTLGGLSLESLRQAREDHGLLEQIRAAEVVSERMFRAAADYHANAPRNFSDYARDKRIYYRQLQLDLGQLEGAVDLISETAGADSQAAPDLALAIGRLDAAWDGFHEGLVVQLGDDPEEPRLEWGTRHISEAREPLRFAIDQVAGAAMARADARMDRAERLATRVIPAVTAGLVILVALLALLLQRRISRIVRTGHDLVRGRFGAAVHYGGEDDFSAVDGALASASRRIATAMALIDGVQRARKIQGLLDQFRLTASEILPLEWTALYFVDGEPPTASRRAVSGGHGALPASFRLTHLPKDGFGLLADWPGAPEQLAAGQANTQPPGVLWLPAGGAQGFLLLLAPPPGEAWKDADTEFMAQLAPLLGHGLEKVELTERLLVATIIGLARLAESRDPETGNHLVRMSEYSRLIALGLRELGGTDAASVSDAFVEDIHRFAPMHDIGKVGVPDAILRKPGRLDEDEMGQMREHPRIGGDVLRACRAPLPQLDGELFQLAIDIAETHHEKFDGSGYPNGLVGKAIPLAGRIIAVADVLDALASRRPYKEPWPMDRVWALLKEGRGAHFDPDVVDAALLVQDRILAVKDAYGVD